MPLELTAAARATDAAIHKKMFGSGMATLITSNEEMNDTMKIVKSLEESGLLIKGISESVSSCRSCKRFVPNLSFFCELFIMHCYLCSYNPWFGI